ncbi:2'-5' RNA ligase [Runella defluvii]|uniref:2'-5' RNA ligase n=1 Tax=Runella defluvii TaxID=370973 RepID=A0A7W5ZJW1_9BACT|nr:mutarotase [Runella defluvii]MBB3838657.1 2'-5' RNA ligase [Runella defluvii]
MNLEAHYQQMWLAANEGFAKGLFEYDPLIDSPVDTRRGITLIARPSAESKQQIHTMLDALFLLEPQQYYYPLTDIHLTVLSIISCYEGFSLSAIHPQEYIDRIREVVKKYAGFRVRFSGITASASCVLVQGFPMDDTLAAIRNDLRTTFKTSSLQHSIDKRYSIQTAHSTVIRFRVPLVQPVAFVERLQAFYAHDFGTFDVNMLELVFNDWYQRSENFLLLESFFLGVNANQFT